MAFDLTRNARNQSDKTNIEPQIVLEIEGVSTKYGAIPILKYIRIGDPDLYIGVPLPDEVDVWKIGGFSILGDQEANISFDGTSSSIQQQLQQDKNSSSSISSVQVALVDFNGSVTRLITPGEIVADVMGRSATLWLGFNNTAFPDDFIRVFRGIIDDINSFQGKVVFNIASPDQKKRQDVFIKGEDNLDGSINASVTTITVNDTSKFFDRIFGPDGTKDTNFNTYIRIDDEIIKYTGISGTQFTGCVRGQFNSGTSSHADDATVESFYRLEGNAIDIALKFMCSGINDYFVSSLDIKNYYEITPGTNVDNAIYFQDLDIADQYGVVAGDFVTTSGASNGANNVTLKPILEVVKVDTGSYLVIDDVSFVAELDTAAVCSIRSQYDTLPDGLAMTGDQIDIAEHLRLKRLFLSSFEYDFYLKDTIKGKEFLEQDILFPMACFAIPRKTRASIGYHIGPIPSQSITTLDTSNVVSASKLQLRRSSNKNFFNTIIYKYNEDTLEQKYLSGLITVSGTSKTQIPGFGTKALTITAKGMRPLLSGASLAQSASNRRLRRYEFAAQYLDGVQVTYGDFFNTEIGDIVLLDNTELNLSNTKTAERGGGVRFYEVVNKNLEIKTGKVTLNLVDTGFDTAARYCLISPSSRIKFGISDTQFVIYNAYASQFGVDEAKKWTRYKNVIVRVRSDDFSTRNATSQIDHINGNTVYLNSSLGFTPSADDTMTLSHYNDNTEQLKKLYGWMRNTAPFDDSTNRYQML